MGELGFHVRKATQLLNQTHVLCWLQEICDCVIFSCIFSFLRPTCSLLQNSTHEIESTVKFSLRPLTYKTNKRIFFYGQKSKFTRFKAALFFFLYTRFLSFFHSKKSSKVNVLNLILISNIKCECK